MNQSGSPKDGECKTIGLRHIYGTGNKHVRHVNAMRVDLGNVLYAFSQCSCAAGHHRQLALAPVGLLRGDPSSFACEHLRISR